MLNAFTVDVEEYFQVHNFEHQVDRSRWSEFPARLEAPVHRLLDLLARHEARGTFFILAWDKSLAPLVRAIQAAGHEVASHGTTHRLVYEQTPAEFRDDVRVSKERLEDWCGARVRGYRAPSYSIVERSRWALDILAELGFVYDSSIYPIRRQRYGIPSAPRVPYRLPGGLVEFPLPTWRVGAWNVPAAAGAYLRIWPTWVTRRALSQLNAAGQPAAVNVHPWELDPEQPRMTGGAFGGITHYFNLGRTEERLARLLREFDFDSMAAVLAVQGFLDGDQAASAPDRAG